VVQIDDALRGTVREMFSLMYAARGIGLAANQVSLPFRFFVLNLTADPEQKDKEQVFINPEIVKRHSSVEEEEGCLSIPGLYAKVQRARKIKVQAFDLEGNLVEISADDLYGRAIQHETDHLNGRLFVDLIKPENLPAVNPKLREFEESFRHAQSSGEYPDDDTIIKELDDLARGQKGLDGSR